MFQVIVIIDPPTKHDEVHQLDVKFCDDWKQALQYVKQVAVGDDPGHVTMLSYSDNRNPLLDEITAECRLIESAAGDDQYVGAQRLAGLVREMLGAQT